MGHYYSSSDSANRIGLELYRDENILVDAHFSDQQCYISFMASKSVKINVVEIELNIVSSGNPIKADRLSLRHENNTVLSCQSVSDQTRKQKRRTYFA